MHILANFVIFDDFGPFLIENEHFGPLLRTSNSLLSKSHDISAFKPMDLSGPAQNPVILTLILTILDPFCGSWREAAARPRTSCLWAGGPAQSRSNPCPGPQILVILTSFGLILGPKQGVKSVKWWFLYLNLHKATLKGLGGGFGHICTISYHFAPNRKVPFCWV